MFYDLGRKNEKLNINKTLKNLNKHNFSRFFFRREERGMTFREKMHPYRFLLDAFLRQWSKRFLIQKLTLRTRVLRFLNLQRTSRPFQSSFLQPKYKDITAHLFLFI